MSLGDQAGLKAVQELNATTLPELHKLAEAILADLERIIERLNGATVTITVTLKDSNK
jgi:hypothetical protein